MLSKLKLLRERCEQLENENQELRSRLGLEQLDEPSQVAEKLEIEEKEEEDWKRNPKFPAEILEKIYRATLKSLKGGKEVPNEPSVVENYFAGLTEEPRDPKKVTEDAKKKVSDYYSGEVNELKKHASQELLKKTLQEGMKAFDDAFEEQRKSDHWRVVKKCFPRLAANVENPWEVDKKVRVEFKKFAMEKLGCNHPEEVVRTIGSYTNWNLVPIGEGSSGPKKARLSKANNDNKGPSTSA